MRDWKNIFDVPGTLPFFFEEAKRGLRSRKKNIRIFLMSSGKGRTKEPEREKGVESYVKF